MVRRTFLAVTVALAGLTFTAFFLSLPARAVSEKPSIIVSPVKGAFEIGQNFDVSIGINTAGQSINAFKIKLRFPPDKLQVVSPSIGQSVTGLWVRRPSYSNETGEIDLEGAIPSPGINTSFGVLATVTFRVKSLGQALLSFSGDSALYLNDGQGTPVETTSQNGSYHLALPAPQGPVVSSPTHPDQDAWYNINDVVLRWNDSGSVEGYSYILSETPVDIPDTISDGSSPQTTYTGLADGVYYFHVRALRDGVWGGTSHFGIKIQKGAPAKFTIDANVGSRTSSKTIVFTFETTDALSGMHHYEASMVRQNDSVDRGSHPFFFETRSPYVFTAQNHGTYIFTVRAYNQAGNYTESTAKISVVRPIFAFITDGGIKIGDCIISWYVFWIAIMILASILWLTISRMLRWYVRTELARVKHREDRLRVIHRRSSRTKDEQS